MEIGHALPPKTPQNPDLDKVNNSNDPFELDLDWIIATLSELRKHPTKRGEIPERVIQGVCFLARQNYASEPLLVEVKGSIVIIGDIHGQFFDLLRIFEVIGPPPKNAFLFLGDYIDRGHQGVDVLMLLLAYQLKYPNKVYLLRGNHENCQLNKYYGFYHEIEQRYGKSAMKVWKSFLRMFQEMPLAALIEESIFCVHGGLSPNFFQGNFDNLHDYFKAIERPVNIETMGFVCDLLWSDPMDKTDDQCKGWEPNSRGMAYAFGTDIVEEFCSKFNVNLIVRGHQVVEDGYEFYAKRRLVTLFSAPRYCGVYDNAGGVILIDKIEEANPKDGDILKAKFKIIKPERRFITTLWYDTETFVPPTSK